MKTRRTCADRNRWRRLTELRAWFAKVLTTPNDGRRERLVLYHAAVESGEFDYGWSSWATVTLRDGREFVRGGPGPGSGLPSEVARMMYFYLSRQARKNYPRRLPAEHTTRIKAAGSRRG